MWYIDGHGTKIGKGSNSVSPSYVVRFSLLLVSYLYVRGYKDIWNFAVVGIEIEIEITRSRKL